MDTKPLGRIVFVDGPDGVGKTTQIREIATYLESLGREVYITRVNGGTEIGEELRKVFLSHSHRPASADMYIALALNAALAEQVNAKKAAGLFVLIDRSPAAIVAYQGFGSGVDLQIITDAAKSAFAMYEYDAMLCYQAPLEVLYAHQQSRPMAENSDYFESKPEDYIQNVIKGYMYAAEQFNFPLIDASGSIEDVTKRTLVQLAHLL